MQNKQILVFAVAVVLFIPAFVRADPESAANQNREAAPTVTLYFADFQATGNGLPVVVEINNPGTQSIRVNSVVKILISPIAPAGARVVPSRAEQKADQSDLYVPTLSLEFPLVLGRDNPAVNFSLVLGRNKEVMVLEPGKTILTRLNLPRIMFPPGTSTLKIVLIQRGVEVAKSKQSKITADENTP